VTTVPGVLDAIVIGPALLYPAFALGETTVFRKTLGWVLGCALLSCGSYALAFTLIPQEQLSPSNSVTDSTTLQTQVQPIATTVRSQILTHLRARGSQKKATGIGGMMLAANAHAGASFDYLAAASGDSPAMGSGSSGGNSESVWFSGVTSSLENTFSRTAFHGATNNIIAGFDVTRSDRYVLGVSVGHEASNFTTTFNNGDEKTRGFNVNPYFAFLLSDKWSLDLVLGYGKFDTRQNRILATGPLTTQSVSSEFDSNRGFASTNLTNVSTLGNWKLTGSLGFLGSRRENDAYTESIGTMVAESKQTSKQWNFLGEAAYGRGNSEVFFGAMYEDNYDQEKLQFAVGPQPANDPESVVLTAGWRYFGGKGLTGSFVFSGRRGQDQVREYGLSMMLRVDL
jgi:hypothetical protein